MKRPLFVVGAAYFTATRLAFWSGESRALELSAAALLTAALCFLLRGRGRAMYPACIVLLTVAVAFAGFWVHVERETAPLLKLEGTTALIEGLITDVDSGPASTSHTIRASFPEHPAMPANVTVIVRSAGGLEYARGDTVSCRVRLSAAPDTVWYKSRGILLAGTAPRNVKSAPESGRTLERTLIRLRDKMAQNLYSHLSGETAGVMSALVLGMKSDISPGTYAALGRAGTVHLLSVSGLHLSILSALCLGALGALRCSRRAGAAAAIITAFLFTALVGFEASVFRSFVMTAAALLGRLTSRRADSLSSLGLAMLICGVFWPYWTLGWGLWLSACSTLGIILFAGRVSGSLYGVLKRGSPVSDRFVKAAAEAGGVSVAAYAFTLPLLLLMSGWVSLIAPFANILVAPFVPPAMLGGVACALLPGTSLPVRLAAWVAESSLSVILRISEILSRLPFAIAAVNESWMLIWLFGMCAFAATLLIGQNSKRLTGCAISLLLILFSAGSLSHDISNRDRIELVTLTPYNCALLLRAGEAVILGTPDAYEISNLLKYLNFRGVRAIPAVVAADCGEQINSGVLRLAEQYDIDCVIAPNDAYIADMLREALPGSLVYEGGYAEVTALGGAVISMSLPEGGIHVSIGQNQIVKTREDCDIIKYDGGAVEIYNGGEMLLPESVIPAFEPVGARLFGESRISLAAGGQK